MTNQHDGNRPLPFDRDTLGRMVREAWVRWAQTHLAPKPSWLVAYDDISESDKEADRQIGECVARWTLIGAAAAKAAETPAIDPDMGYQAESAECAHLHLDTLGVARDEGDQQLSLVGRIITMREKLDHDKEKLSREILRLVAALSSKG